MYGGKRTLYDVLEVTRRASARDVAKAYKRLTEAMKKGEERPDPHRVALLHEAYEVLSDDQRRAAYDKSLRGESFWSLPEASRLNLKYVAIGAILAAAVVVYLAMRNSTRSQTTEQQILSDASFSVSRVQKLDPSGGRTPLGLAFAIDEGVMATTCHGLPAGGSLAIDNGERANAARVAIADEVLDVCRLHVAGGASRAMVIGRDPPRPGDKLYVVHFEGGKTTLEEGTSKGIVPTPDGNLIEISQAITPEMSGGPLIDADGRVVGIVSAPNRFAAGKSVALPARWIAEARTRQASGPTPPASGKRR